MPAGRLEGASQGGEGFRIQVPPLMTPDPA